MSIHAVEIENFHIKKTAASGGTAGIAAGNCMRVFVWRRSESSRGGTDGRGLYLYGK